MHILEEVRCTHAYTHKHVSTCTRPFATLLVHRATRRLCTIPLKVLWAVISKTIPWMAALIENNEGHIEHMVAVVSPFPPSSLLHFVCLSLPKTSGQKVQSNFATARQRSVKKKRTLSKLFSPFFFFFSPDKLMSTQSVRRAVTSQVSCWQNANPAETSCGENTGLSIVLISSSFVLHASMDICSSLPRSLLSLRVEE